MYILLFYIYQISGMFWLVVNSLQWEKRKEIYKVIVT